MLNEVKLQATFTHATDVKLHHIGSYIRNSDEVLARLKREFENVITMFHKKLCDVRVPRPRHFMKDRLTIRVLTADVGAIF